MIIRLTYIVFSGAGQDILLPAYNNRFEDIVQQLGPIQLTTERLTTGLSLRARQLYAIYYNSLPTQAQTGSVGGVQRVPVPIVVLEIDNEIVYMKGILQTSAPELRQLINDALSVQTPTTGGETVGGGSPLGSGAVQASGGLALGIFAALIYFGTRNT